MNRFKFSGNYEEPYPEGLGKYKPLMYEKGGDILICLKHYKGVTKCIEWSKWIKGKKKGENLQIKFIYDKWILQLFKPFELTWQSFKKHPRQFTMVLWLRLQIRWGRIK